MHFGRKNPNVYYTMNGHAPAGTVLEVVDNEKDLGIIIHKSLKPSRIWLEFGLLKGHSPQYFCVKFCF